MFLLEPDETRYDLRWRMFGTSVRVHPMFWLMSVVLGYDANIRLGIGYVLAWVICVFVSILLHEFGHIWMGRLFGSPGYIVLFSFGGLAIGSKQVPHRWQRILVCLAGPLIQLLLWVALWYGGMRIILLFPGRMIVPAFIVWRMLFGINLLWPLLNLLPIWPLDGGQVTREVCQGASPSSGTVFSLGISMVVSGFLAVHELMASQGRPLLRLPVNDSSPQLLQDINDWLKHGSMFTALFFALFCFSSFAALQEENQRRRQWSEDDWHWER